MNQPLLSNAFQQGPNITELKATLDQNFPGLWPAVDVGLSTCATLLLSDNSNPSAVVLIGPASSSKTTVAEMFSDPSLSEHPLIYHSDNFTPASFVSHAANVGPNRLDTIDLLPRIKHKMLVTPELAPIFRGKEEDLKQRFATLTRVLDGQGLRTDSGTHGRRGYRGDYLFAWLGCTTPFEAKVWKVMAQLGSRLFFYPMYSSGQTTPTDLVNSLAGPSYKDRLETCRIAVLSFMTHLFESGGGVRGVTWPHYPQDKDLETWISHLAPLLSTMRSQSRLGEEDQGTNAEESPRRAFAGLYNLARAHALVHGRQYLTGEDLPLVCAVAIGSIPPRERTILLALLEHGGTLTTYQAQIALKVKSSNTARAAIESVATNGIFDLVQPGNGVSSYVSLKSDWQWLVTAQVGRLYQLGIPTI